MIRAAFRVCIVVLTLTTPTTLALACHCVHGSEAFMADIIAKQLKENGGVLVEAEALSNEGENGAHTTTFKVLEVWVGQAGEPGQNIIVRHNLNGEACGLKFTEGEMLFVLATKNSEGVLMTNQCTQMMAERAKAWGKARVQVMGK